MKAFASVVLVTLLVAPAAAQEKTEGSKSRTLAPLRLQMVISRHQGDRKISSRPYTLTFGSWKQTTLRQGTEVPVAVTVLEKDGRDTTSFQYKNVGINIECTAEPIEGGRYAVLLAFEDSSLFEGEAPRTPSHAAPAAPLFRTNNVRGIVILRDGETVPFSNSTDPVTGDVVKVDVTLDVLK